MRIAIDAMGINFPGGGRTATVNLLNALFALDTKNQYTIALTAKEPSFNAENVKQWIVPVKNRFLIRLYSQFVYPVKFRNYHLIHFSKNLALFNPLPPVIVTMYDMTTLRFPELMPRIDYYYWRTFQKWTLQGAQQIITISEDAANDIVHYYGIPRKKIKVIYPACSPHFTPTSPEVIRQVKREYHLPDQYLLHVGHLDRKKNLPTLVRAFDRVRKETNFGGKLVLVGEVYEKCRDASLMPTIHSLGLENEVVFTGRVADEDLPAVYTGAYAMVFPSHHEGFGLAPLEAISCGTPLIAHKAGAVGEVIGDGGIILEKNDVDTVATAINRVVSDSSLRQALIEKGLARAKKFNWFETAQQTLKVYEQVAQHKAIKES